MNKLLKHCVIFEDSTIKKFEKRLEKIRLKDYDRILIMYS